MDNQNLLLGIEEAKKGNYEKASEYLAKVVQSDPTNTDGWLFLGHCLSDVKKKRYCYQRVLAINPQNEIAKASLVRLDDHQKLEPPIAESVSLAFSQETSTSAPVTDRPSKLNKSKQGGVLGALVFGFMLAMFVCTLPGILLVMSGKFDNYLIGKYLVDEVVQAQPSTSGPFQDLNTIDAYLANARQAMDDEDYEKAIPYLDTAIDLAPQNYLAYAMRARCYYELTNNEHFFDVYNSNLQQALADIDAAVSLQPADPELYVLRRDILSEISSSLSHQADHEYLLTSAIENERTFLSLSPSLDRRLRISALLAGDLILAGQCEEGLQLVEDLENKVQPANNSTYGSLIVAMALGNACLGDMDKAAQSMDQIISISNNYLKARVYLKALYLYQAGKTQLALDTLNASINADPTFTGNRYYLRALIYLDMGDKEQAIQDLSTGEMYTWNRADLYAYAKAKLALEEGNTEDAIYWFQVAEDSFTPDESVLHKQILEELSQLGAQPLEKSISIDFQTTPMSPVTPIP